MDLGADLCGVEERWATTLDVSEGLVLTGGCVAVCVCWLARRAVCVMQEKIKVSADEPANMSSLQELHEKLQEVEKEMKEHTDKYSLLVKQRTELDEHLQVLNKASQWFGQVNRAGIEFPASTAEEGRNEMSMLLEDGGEGAGSGAKRLSMLGHLAGCIPTANLNDFRMTLFRATRGNMHLQHQPVDRRDLSGDTDELKSVFIVYFSGERSRQKIAKICDSYAATTYAVSDSATLRDREEQGVKERLRDLEIVIRSTGDYRKNKLRSIAGSILLWEAHVMREKVCVCVCVCVCVTRMSKAEIEIAVDLEGCRGWSLQCVKCGHSLSNVVCVPTRLVFCPPPY
jgi:vacuolar-type H+-ATPase subunit I/STV1